MNNLLPECLEAISYGDTPSIIKDWIGKEYVETSDITGKRACSSDCQARVDVKQIKIELCSRCPKF